MVYKRFATLHGRNLQRIIQSYRALSSCLPRRALAALVAALLLGGCATQNFPSPSSSATPAAPAQAHQAFAEGNYQQAAHLYVKLARNGPAASRGERLLKASDAALRAHDWRLAQRTLATIDRASLNRGQRTQMDMLSARLNLAEHHPRRALAALPQPGAQVPTASAAAISRLRARALFALGRTLPATRAAVASAQAASGAGPRQADNQWLWDKLQKSTLQGSAVKGWKQAQTTVRGWIALARIAHSDYFNAQRLQQRLQRWQQNYPQHPAAVAIVPQLMNGARQGRPYPAQIALLLPLSGQLSAPAKAVRDGFLSAYYAQPPDTRPQLRLYVTHPGKHDAGRLFRRAVNDGASIVVGPLAPQTVQAVAKADRGSVTVLALNYLPKSEQPPSHFYQMGLSPEDDARQVALRASQDGLHRALALVPSGHWGNRVFKAFRRALKAQGGSVVQAARYNPKQADHSQSIVYLLGLPPNVVHSTHTAKLKPHTGADFIFLAATPAQGRLIRPELRFYNAGLPVYATSSIYAGHPQPDKDEEMDGIRFCDMPWLLHPQQKDLAALRGSVDGAWPGAAQQAPRLVALGVDAYRVIPALKSGALAQGHQFPGVTGQLQMGPHQRIRRSLVCAQFKDGRPAPLANASAKADATAKAKAGSGH